MVETEGGGPLAVAAMGYLHHRGRWTMGDGDGPRKVDCVLIGPSPGAAQAIVPA